MKASTIAAVIIILIIIVIIIVILSLISRQHNLTSNSFEKEMEASGIKLKQIEKTERLDKSINYTYEYNGERFAAIEFPNKKLLDSELKASQNTDYFLDENKLDQNGKSQSSILPVHFFSKDLFLVIYPGNDKKLLNAFEEILGKEL